MSSTPAAASSALQALNSAFVRKGIVATTSANVLPDDVQALLATLEQACKRSCTDARDIASALQLWKERSLHQTLQVLEASAAASPDRRIEATTNQEKQMEAIESHERASRELSDVLTRHRVDAARSVHDHIDTFAASLAAVLSELIRPELADELDRTHTVVQRLAEEKQQLEQRYAALEQTSSVLDARLDAIENAPDGGGDAELCRKLRARVRALAASDAELRANADAIVLEREQHRFAMQQLRNALEQQQRTFVLTKAMHEKETKQLVALVQSRQQQFVHVMQTASSTAAGVGAAAGAPNTELQGSRSPVKRGQQLPQPSLGRTMIASTTTLDVYDPVSGRTVQFARTASPQKSRFATLSSVSPTRSPTKRPSTSSTATPESPSQQHPPVDSTVFTPSSHPQPQQPASPSATSLRSPTGHVRRLVPTTTFA